MNKLKLLMAACALMVGCMTANAQASYNKDYKAGVAVAAGGDYFLYNIGAKMFLTSGLNYGTRATVDNSGRVLTLTANGDGYSIYTNFVSLNNRQENTRKAGYLTTNGYVDTGSSDAAWVFTPVSVDGYTNAYTIKNSDTQYLFFDVANTDPGCPVNVGNNTGNNYSYWLLIPKTTREEAGDYSHYLINTQMNACWEYKTWGGSTGWNDYAIVQPGGLVSNRCGEKYHTVVDIYQEIKESLPNGKYRLSAQGFYRQDDGKTQDAPVLYANTNTSGIGVMTGTENSMDDASTSFTAGKYANNSVETVVTDGSLRVGINITGANQWVIFDNFYLEYLGSCLVNDAIALPENGDMTANTWYYFDISAAADNYTVTATALEGVVCTSDGNSLTAEATGNITLKAENNTFAAQRYYVKSTSANNLKISVASYAYELGDATLSVADGKYTQTQTFTVTFPDAASNDPSASAELVTGSKATVNGTEVALSAVTNGFSIDLGELTTSTDYTISIPANVYGYDGESMNSAISLTIHTPIVFDGTFFLYNDFTKSFLARGMNYGTRAVVDKYGVPVNMVTNENGLSTLKFVDNDLYLGSTWWMYADNSTANTFKVIPSTVEGASGYHFATQEVSSNLSDKKYMYVYLKDDADKYACAGNSTLDENITDWKQTVWQLKSVTERDAIIDAYPADNIQNVITASGISTTSTEFPTYLSNHYTTVDMTSNIGTATFAGSAGDWTWTGVRGQDGQPAYGTNFAEVWNATGSFTQTIDKEKLPAGIYKVTVQGYERRKDNTASANLYNAGYKLVSTYLAANDEKVRFTDWNEVDGKPTNTGGAVTAFGKGEAVNEVYVYLDGATDLTLTVKKPNYIWDNWAIFNNFTLTYYQPVENITITSAGYATYVSDNDLDYTSVDGLTAYKATVSGSTITFNKVTTVPAGEGVLLKGEAKAYSVPVTAGVAAWADADNAFIRGTGAAVETGSNPFNYILNNVGGVVGFYKANGQIVATNRAYLQAPVSASRLSFVFDDEEEVTGIKTINTVKNGEAIYNLNGQRVNKAKNGLYILNGRKVMFK